MTSDDREALQAIRVRLAQVGDVLADVDAQLVREMQGASDVAPLAGILQATRTLAALGESIELARKGRGRR